MLIKHKSAAVTKALIHVLTGNGEQNSSTAHFFIHKLFIEVSTEKYNEEIGDVVGEIMCRDDLDLNTADYLMNLIQVLNKIEFNSMTKILLKGICNILSKFVPEEDFCLKFLGMIDSKSIRFICK